MHRTQLGSLGVPYLGVDWGGGGSREHGMGRCSRAAVSASHGSHAAAWSTQAWWWEGRWGAGARHIQKHTHTHTHTYLPHTHAHPVTPINTHTHTPHTFIYTQHTCSYTVPPHTHPSLHTLTHYTLHHKYSYTHTDTHPHLHTFTEVLIGQEYLKKVTKTFLVGVRIN